MPPITINGNTLDPHVQAHRMQTQGFLATNAEQTNYILIQAEGPLSKDQKSQLATLGAVIQEYVSEDTYLVEYKPTDLDAIRRLPFVTWANIYNKQFKVQARLKGARASHNIIDDQDQVKGKDEHNVEIIFHKGADLNEEILSQVAQITGLNRDSMSVTGHKIHAVVQHDALDLLAGLDGVKAMQEVHKMTTFNNKAREVLMADPALNGAVFQGDGQVVVVGDTGFDVGSTSDDDILPAFKGRVLKLWPFNGHGREGLTDDPHGHGTHVAGSVLGDGRSDKLGENKVIQGTAPKAKLALQSLASKEGPGEYGLGGIPDDLEELFKPPYSDAEVAARVHTNSWGPTSSHLPYGQAYQVDKFVWENQDMVICFAAGNEGVDVRPAEGKIDEGQIGLYASAKNSITVGASENDRPDITATYGQYGYNQKPLRDDRTANNPNGMAAFSNRGYTPGDGRVKPDIVAPGTAVLSAASQHPEARTGRPLLDPDWRFMDGTSMATPLVAGCAAVIREALEKEAKLKFIPAALVKALLINGADELKGQYATQNDAGPSPNSSSGWGRVNLTRAVQIVGSAKNSGFVIGEPIEQGEEHTNSIPTLGNGVKVLASSADRQAPLTATSSSSTLKVTLVWTDPPGEILQNSLDLIVIGSDGGEYHGNFGNTKTTYDRNNNVQQVIWNNVSHGEAKIVVKAFRIITSPQPFAYAWSVTKP